MSYDEQYAGHDALFGVEADAILASFSERLTPGATVLDVGAGQGRNARYLAERGFTVHALEPSRVGVAALARLAQESGLDIQVHAEAFEQFTPPALPLDGIAACGLIPDLDWPAIHRLLARIDAWGAAGTIVWLTGFTTQDPAFGRQATHGTALGANSFRSQGGRVRTYLEPGEILRLCARYAVLHHWEGLGPEHRHGDGPKERHGWFETVLLREPA